MLKMMEYIAEVAKKCQPRHILLSRIPVLLYLSEAGLIY